MSDLEVIKTLIGLIEGLQISVGNLTESCKMMKDRIEALEGRK